MREMKMIKEIKEMKKIKEIKKIRRIRKILIQKSSKIFLLKLNLKLAFK